jgi:hypothetical protein
MTYKYPTTSASAGGASYPSAGASPKTVNIGSGLLSVPANRSLVATSPHTLGAKNITGGTIVSSVSTSPVGGVPSAASPITTPGGAISVGSMIGPGVASANSCTTCTAVGNWMSEYWWVVLVGVVVLILLVLGVVG